mgnify:CR=1 FL=1
MDEQDHVEAQADYMREELKDMRSTLVSLGNKLDPLTDRLEGVENAHELEDVADGVHFLLEDELQHMLNTVREMDREARELKVSAVTDEGDIEIG